MQSACSLGPLLQRRTFFQGAPLKQAGPGGADTRHKPATNSITKTKEVCQSKKDLLKDNIPKSELINNTSNSKQESNSISVAIKTNIHASLVVNCSINNNHFQSSPSLPPNSA